MGGGLISSIRSIDLRLVDDLVDFVRGQGFVLDFSDASFTEFFASELQVDIDDPKYSVKGGSKGKDADTTAAQWFQVLFLRQ